MSSYQQNSILNYLDKVPECEVFKHLYNPFQDNDTLSCFQSRALSVTQQQTKECEGAKIRNRYNQVPHLTQDTNGKVTNSQLDITNVCKEVSPFPTSDHKA